MADEKKLVPDENQGDIVIYRKMATRKSMSALWMRPYG